MIEIKTYSGNVSADLLIVPFVEEKFDMKMVAARLAPAGLTDERLAQQFRGAKKEIFQVAGAGLEAVQVLLLGLGKQPDAGSVINQLRALFSANKSKWSGKITVDLQGMEELAASVSNGMALGSYEMGMLKTREEEEKSLYTDGSELAIRVSEGRADEISKEVLKGICTADTQMNMMHLVNAPSNYKTPETMAEYILKSGREHGYEVTVFDEKACHEKGFHALLAVGRGSVDRPVRMAILEYRGKGKKVGLVGKGVTFDTGGVSLKPGDGMEDMKMDMGGSAAVIGTVELAARLGLPVHLTGVVAFTENCIDALSIKPGDVINTYARKTIEVINTDAEGRLILADALYFMATEYEPEIMIDLATLTGSCIRTLGHVAAGLMTNNDKLASQLEMAGSSTGEKVWRLPLTDDYRDELNSDVADIKNLGGPYAGATTAGKFLEYFTNEHPCWAHLDIAGTAFMKSEFSKGGSATAYGVRLLTRFIENLA